MDLTEMESLNLLLEGLSIQKDVPLARYTSARVGGPADWLVVVNSAEELANAAGALWGSGVSFRVLGGGSNVLVSDAGVREVVLLNRAREVQFIAEHGPEPTVQAESGANFGLVARLAAQRGLSGLEWAAGIPGTVGGAVFGNAGAHGSDTSSCLAMAEILQRDGQHSRRASWLMEQFGYEYRSSILKRDPQQAVILAAVFRLERSTPETVQAKLDELVAFRHHTQPPGASMGSMFKNPPGDYAGRLIEAAGLKSAQIGGAQISTLHANFFVNTGQATAADVYDLIRMAQEEVATQFGIHLELEIELIGEWVTR
jgi:UDP-N-acetylmuramate dehydrogenase